MKKFKKVTSLFLLCTLPFVAFCQPVFTATETNLSQIITQIQNLYGDQIDLSDTDLYNFLFPLVQNTASEETCASPSPQIDQLGGGSVTFSWPATSQANSYSTFHLNLNDGSNGGSTLNNPGVSYNNLQGLHLFGFSTNCETGDQSGVGIIIVEMDILGPENGYSSPLCVCPNATSATIYTGPGTISIFSVPWTEDYVSTRYGIQVNGVRGIDGSLVGYSSSLSFAYVEDMIEAKVYLMPNCDDNATSSYYPLQVGSFGETGFYFLEFLDSELRIHLNTPDFISTSVKVETSDCNNPDSDLPTYKNTAIAPIQFMAFPNPTSQYTQFQYELSKDSQVQLIAYDILGREVYSILPSTQQAKGIHQLSVDLSSWPKGIYSCRLVTDHYNQTINIQKE